MSMCFAAERDTRVFVGGGDDFFLHCMDCCFDSGSKRTTMFHPLSQSCRGNAVLPSAIVARNFLRLQLGVPFHWLTRRRGTHLSIIQRISSTSVTILFTVPYESSDALTCRNHSPRSSSIFARQYFYP